MKSNQLFKCETEKALLARILNFDEDPNFDNIAEFKVKRMGDRWRKGNWVYLETYSDPMRNWGLRESLQIN